MTSVAAVWGRVHTPPRTLALLSVFALLELAGARSMADSVAGFRLRTHLPVPQLLHLGFGALSALLCVDGMALVASAGRRVLAARCVWLLVTIALVVAVGSLAAATGTGEAILIVRNGLLGLALGLVAAVALLPELVWVGPMAALAAGVLFGVQGSRVLPWGVVIDLETSPVQLGAVVLAVATVGAWYCAAPLCRGSSRAQRRLVVTR